MKSLNNQFSGFQRFHYNNFHIDNYLSTKSQEISKDVRPFLHWSLFHSLQWKPSKTLWSMWKIAFFREDSWTCRRFQIQNKTDRLRGFTFVGGVIILVDWTRINHVSGQRLFVISGTIMARLISVVFRWQVCWPYDDLLYMFAFYSDNDNNLFKKKRESFFYWLFL